ncbi:sugar phosphate isomerase/epimerase family protein [Stappia indica]|uniref:sugar phosphate isomerase/epimerase family protein n=1 Tax=Stappia indica TaxID=538381 RepID=UPI001CD258E1|nr:sugar phosphate isomerase/epimerase [Stappia indica]MCA1298088.1 sugar phosphate isomerase/epimerase [Stappia indica]
MANGVFGVGMSTRTRDGDLADLGAELDCLEDLGVDLIELSAFDYDLVIGGKIRDAQFKTLRGLCAGRQPAFSVHGPLSLNFMDVPDRLERHYHLLETWLDITAELGAEHYVVHAGMTLETDPARQQEAYVRQRDWLARAGDLARARNLHICVETLFEHDDWKHTPTPARLAEELTAIGHPNVCATIDFGHSYIKLDADGRRDDLPAEAALLAPQARHLHIHDCFGRQDDMWVYTESERLALGLGDLHLPVGWGDIPWQEIMAACVFPEGVVFNIELNPRFSAAARECIAATRALAAQARTRAADKTGG